MGAELFRADRQTDMTKLIVAFRNFSNARRYSTFCAHNVFMCFLRTQCIYVFCMDLRTNSVYFPIQH